MLQCAVSFVLSNLPTLRLSTLCVNCSSTLFLTDCNVFLTDTQSAGSFGSVEEGLLSMTKWVTPAHHHWLWTGNTNCLVSLSSMDHAVWFKQRYYYCYTRLTAFSRTTWVSQYPKGKTSLDLNEPRDDDVWGWQWHQLDHMQTICTLLQINNHTNNTSLNFYKPAPLPNAQPEVSKHWWHLNGHKWQNKFASHHKRCDACG